MCKSNPLFCDCHEWATPNAPRQSDMKKARAVLAEAASPAGLPRHSCRQGIEPCAACDEAEAASPAALDVLDVIAARIRYEALEDAEPLWEDYPDIGEHDWQRIVERVPIEAPDGKAFAAAYSTLRTRARLSPSEGSDR